MTGGIVTSEMVEAAARTWCGFFDTGFDALPEAGKALCLKHMRAALNAAMHVASTRDERECPHSAFDCCTCFAPATKATR